MRRAAAANFACSAGSTLVRLLLDPLHVRPEARATREIQCEVRAEPAGLGHWIDQARERHATRIGKIVAARQEASWHMHRIERLDRARHRMRTEPGRVDEPLGRDHEASVLRRLRR